MIAIQIFLSYMFFFLALLVSFYIPGILVLSYSGKVFSQGTKQVLAWGIGYSCFIFLSYVGAWIHFPYLSLVAILGVCGYVLLFKRKLLRISITKTHWLVSVLIILGSLSFLGTSFLSGLTTSHGFQFIGSVNGTDAVMHTARIKTQLFAFPPVYTGFAGYAVRGYHYFYDFLLSRFSLFYHFSAEDLYYRLFPLFLSLLYGCTVYLFSSLYTKKNSQKVWILFFVYFAESFGFLLSLFTKSVDIANGMGLVQPLELILDPSSVFAITVLMIGCYLLLQKRNSLFLVLLAGFVLGLLAQLKVYAGIVTLGALALWLVYLFLSKKQVKLYSITFLVATFFTAITYLPNNYGVGKLLFSPFFLYDTFIKQNKLFASWNWDIRMIIYQQHHNMPHILFMYLVAAVLFWVLTLGSRILLLIKVPVLCTKKFWKDAKNVLFLLVLLVPLIIASLFVQSISIFDTVQFLWIIGVLLCIPAGIFYGELFDRLPRLGKYSLVILVIFLSLGAYLSDEHTYMFHPQFTRVSPAQLQVVTSIQKSIPQSNFFVVAPSYIVNQQGQKEFQYYPAPLLASLTGKQTYYEYEIPVFPDNKMISYRKQQVERITLHVQACDGKTVANIMRGIGSQYLVTMFVVECKQLPYMKKLAVGDDWVFWRVD